MKKLPLQDLEHVLSHTDGLWEKLRGKRVFLTGGTGFFGAWLVESFLHANARLELGASLHLLTRDPEAFLKRMSHLTGAVDLICGDIETFNFPDGEFSHLIHAAMSTAAGTARVIEFASHCRASRFLNTSSGAVYAAPSPGRAAYRDSKLESEQLLVKTRGLEWVNARCFAFVGPHLPLNTEYAIGNFIGDALHERTIQMRGDGSPQRSYLYAADLAIWLWTLLFRGTPGTHYDVGSEHTLSIREVAETVARVAGKLGLKTEVPTRISGGAASQPYVPSTTRARQELGLETWIDLEDGIERTLRWLR